MINIFKYINFISGIYSFPDLFLLQFCFLGLRNIGMFGYLNLENWLF